MIIDCISDLHGYYPKLDGGDLLIVAGDLTARDELEEYIYFRDWLSSQKYKKKIVIAGNHDNELELYHLWSTPFLEIADYLCNSGTEFEGLKIWGSPWTKTFKGMNPHCKAFTCETEDELESHFRNIPDNIDILITHSPPFGILDKTFQGNLVGSKKLREKIFEVHPKIIIFGHIHENGGKERKIFNENAIENGYIHCINASIMNEKYKPVNKPLRVIL